MDTEEKIITKRTRRKVIQNFETLPESVGFENKEQIITNTKKTKHMNLFKKIFTKRNSIVILFVVLLIACIYFFVQYRKLSRTPDVIAKEKTAEVIKKISELAIVPNDPGAVLATVTDITKLKDQHFFANAQNGDQIVIFPSVMKAVLYRPSINRIVDIGPLSSSPSTDTTTSQTTNTSTSSKTTNQSLKINTTVNKNSNK